jgi:hypothetical protein
MNSIIKLSPTNANKIIFTFINYDSDNNIIMILDMKIAKIISIMIMTELFEVKEKNMIQFK